MPPIPTIMPNDTPETLAVVKAQFSHWRETRSNRCKIPEVLRGGVRQLTKHYTYSQIASALGLNL